MSKKEGLQTETNWYDRSAKIVGSVAALAVTTGGVAGCASLEKDVGVTIERQCTTHDGGLVGWENVSYKDNPPSFTGYEADKATLHCPKGSTVTPEHSVSYTLFDPTDPTQLNHARWDQMKGESVSYIVKKTNRDDPVLTTESDSTGTEVTIRTLEQSGLAVHLERYEPKKPSRNK